MISRRAVLAGTAALAVVPLIPVQAKEVWHHRGVEVLVKRLPHKVEMHCEVGNWGRCGIGYLTAGRINDHTLRGALRNTIDFQKGRKPVLWGTKLLLG